LLAGVILLIPEDRGAHRQEAKLILSATLLSIIAVPRVTHGQAKPAQPTKKQPAGPPAPQSTHYPILLLAFGNTPDWSLRIGLKGPERLDRPNYPPIPLEPAAVTHESAADSWTYQAKDSATGAAVSVHLTREACTEAVSDPAAAPGPSTGKYTFRVSVDHTQLGSMKGCARIAAELFPKINNQPDAEDEADKKKPPPPTITKFKPPVAMAYLNPAGSVVLSRGAVKKIIAPAGSELCLSHDGKNFSTRAPIRRPLRTARSFSTMRTPQIAGLGARSPSASFLVARRFAHRFSQSARSVLAGLVLPGGHA